MALTRSQQKAADAAAADAGASGDDGDSSLARGVPICGLSIFLLMTVSVECVVG